MSVKKIIGTLATGVILAFAAPVFADRDNQVVVQGDNFERAFARARATGQGFVYRTVWDRHTERYVVEEIPVPYQGSRANGRFRGQPVYQQQPAYRGHPGYRGQPVYQGHPGYRGQPVYSAPAPYYEHRDNTAAVLGGAALGAMVGSQVGDHNTRPAAMAVGAVLGAILGGELSGR